MKTRHIILFLLTMACASGEMATPDASPALRSFVANSKISGVFPGTPPRALINGTLYRAGDLVSPTLGITFAGLTRDVGGDVIFKDHSGSTVMRRFVNPEIAKARSPAATVSAETDDYFEKLREQVRDELVIIRKQRTEHIAQFPNLKPEIRAAILAGEFAVGMNRDDAGAAVGSSRLREISTSKGIGAEVDVCSYNDGAATTYLVFRDGLLVRWSTSPNH